MLTRVAARVMSQPPGDEPSALAMLAGRDGHDDVLRVLRLAGYRNDHPGALRLALDGEDMWQVPAPVQADTATEGMWQNHPHIVRHAALDGSGHHGHPGAFHPEPFGSRRLWRGRLDCRP